MAAKKKNDNMAAKAEKTLAERGKEAAVRFLKRHGYGILDVDWECEQGTIDIVARCVDGNRIVFVVVRTRPDDGTGLSAYGLDPETTRVLRLVAERYLAESGLTDAAVRFDEIDVLVIAPDRALMRHHISADTPVKQDVELKVSAGDVVVEGDSPEAQPAVGVLALAQTYLEKRGYVILDRDWSQDGVALGFDFVAKGEDDQLVFFLVELVDEFDVLMPSIARDEAERLAIGWLAGHPECGEGGVVVDHLAVRPQGSTALVRHYHNLLDAA